MDSNYFSHGTLEQDIRMENMKQASVTITVNGISYCQVASICDIESRKFNFTGDDKIKWSLKLCPIDASVTGRNFFDIYLNIEESSYEEIITLCSLSVLNVGREKKNRYVEMFKFTSNNFTWQQPISIPKEIILEYKNNISRDDKLTFRCDVFYYCKKINNFDTSKTAHVKNPLKTLSNNLYGILKSSKFYDCIILVNSYKIYANKCILAGRSKVFDTMLKNKRDESELSIIEINDFHPSVVEETIKYLYTGTFPNINEITLQMLRFSKIYKLDELKFMAEESLIYSLNNDNIYGYFIASELYEAKILQEWCLLFIFLNAENLVKTPQCKEFLVNQPFLNNKISQFVADDDTYIIMENVKAFLLNEDPNKHGYHGFTLAVGGKSDPHAYNSDGAGYVMSRREASRS
uniref:BTB domain-containing protein n=1 Tax=Strongyloides papillosus TaxID=174720 RepID=A0A0N5BUS6_STREA